jgi:hypothetical protein
LARRRCSKLNSGTIILSNDIAAGSCTMKTLFATFAVVTWLGATATFAAEQTLTGSISDAICVGVHKLMAEQVTPPLSDAECTKTCIEARALYVFVSDSKRALAIANQDFAGLKDHAGQKVKLTGDVRGDSITVLRIEPALNAHPSIRPTTTSATH